MNFSFTFSKYIYKSESKDRVEIVLVLMMMRKKMDEMAENRRLIEERRLQNIPVSGEKRKQEERRIVLQEHAKRIEKFSKIPMFKGLSKEELLKVLRICSKKKLSSQSYLYHFGEETKDMYILMRGSLKVLLRTGEICKVLTPHDCVGEMGFFTEHRRSADVIADTECGLIKLNFTEVSRIFLDDKDLQIKFYENVITELTQKLISDQEEMGQLYNRIRSIDII